MHFLIITMRLILWTNGTIDKFLVWKRKNETCFTAVYFCFLFSIFMVGGKAAVGQNAPEEIIAVEVRRQGHQCTNPSNAQRDEDRTAPNATVWSLTCDEGRYRVTLMPSISTSNVKHLDNRKHTQ